MKQRRAVTLPWLTRLTKDKIAQFEEVGHSCCNATNERDFQGSRTWCWRWLCANGYLSRRAGNKRPNDPAKSRLTMKKWLHMLRNVLYPEDHLQPGEHVSLHYLIKL